MIYKCKCGNTFSEHLGKYGCFNCCGDNVAKLVEMERLTNTEIINKSLAMNIAEGFEFGVLEYLRTERYADLYSLGCFYDFCCELLSLDLSKNIKYYNKYKTKIQYRLRKMKTKGLIDSTKIGSGFLGKTDFGMTYLNCYSLIEK